MTSRFVSGAMLAVSLLTGHGRALAEDTDLFVQPAPAANGAPNVLILLDNTANWNTAFTNEIAALVETVNSLPAEADSPARFRIGLMLFTETGAPNNNVDGAYVRAAMRDLTPAYKTKFMNLLNSLHKTNDKSNGGKAGKTFSEVYQYYKGLAPFSGNRKVKTDYDNNLIGTLQSLAIYAEPENALDSFTDNSYNSPLIDGSCGKNYVIYISNGAAQDNTSDNSTAMTRLAAAAAAEGISGATTPIPISPSGSQANVADEWSRFLFNSSLGVITFTLDVDKVSTGQGPGWTRLLQSIAAAGEAPEEEHYWDVSSGNSGEEIKAALGRIFSQIQAVNSVFASVSLPVSVNTQGTFLNQVYVGMFRPNQDALPRWPGNLKQYKLGIVSGQLRTLDADDSSAINSETGFISECARSFWTPTTVDTYWTNLQQGDCLVVANSKASNTPDGNIVEKGGQAYRLRSTTTRLVKTCDPDFASCSGLTDFEVGNAAITDTLLGAATDAERDALIDWQRGINVDGELGKPNSVMRPSVHGDVLHSRPVAINYGTAEAPEVVVFYGGNDGVLRAINGARTADIDGTAAGSEFWSFMAPEFYPHIKRLRDNSPSITFEGAAPATPAREPKPYGFDGPIAAYQDTDSKWIFPAMRRGGRFLYGFDVTEMATNPGNVSLLWKLGCPNLDNDSDCTTDYVDIGQTWSTPRNIKTNGYTDIVGPKPMLIMGGGYESCEDSDPHSCDSTSKGRSVYLLDAETGALQRQFATDRPVVADVFVVPDGNTGRAKYAYVADLGGNIYRISGASENLPFESTVPASWTITKIASLGCDNVSTCATNRKFMFAPDIVEKSGVYHLLIGSGDREKPLMAFDDAYGTENHFFMVKDNPTDPLWLTNEAGTCGPAVICLDSLVEITSGGSDPDPADLAAMKGWYLNMRDHEQVVTSSITVFGTTTFSTHTPTIPAAGSCASNLGTARVYSVRFSNAGAANGANNRDEQISGGGLPPSPVAGMVELDDGTTVPFVIGADPDSPLESTLPSSPSSGTQPKSLTYWINEK